MTSWLTIATAILAAGVPLIGMVGLLANWFVKITVRAECDASNLELLAKINGTYVRAMGSTLTGAEIERRLNAIVPCPATRHARNAA